MSISKAGKRSFCDGIGMEVVMTAKRLVVGAPLTLLLSYVRDDE